MASVSVSSEYLYSNEEDSQSSLNHSSIQAGSESSEQRESGNSDQNGHENGQERNVTVELNQGIPQASPIHYLPTGHYNPKLHYVFAPNSPENGSGREEGEEKMAQNPHTGVDMRAGYEASVSSASTSSSSSLSSSSRFVPSPRRSSLAPGVPFNEARRQSLSSWNYLNYLSKGGETELNEDFNTQESHFQSLLDRFNFLHESILSIHSRLEAAFQQASFYLDNTSEACGKLYALLQLQQNEDHELLSPMATLTMTSASHPFADLSRRVALSHQKASNRRELLRLQTDLVENCLKKLEAVSLSHDTLFARITTRSSLRQAVIHYQTKLDNFRQSGATNSSRYRRNVTKFTSSESVFKAFNAALVGDLTAAWSSRMLVLGPALNCWIRVEESLNKLFVSTLDNGALGPLDEESENLKEQLKQTEEKAVYSSLVAKLGTQPINIYSPYNKNSSASPASALRRGRSSSQPDIFSTISKNGLSSMRTPMARGISGSSNSSSSFAFPGSKLTLKTEDSTVKHTPIVATVHPTSNGSFSAPSSPIHSQYFENSVREPSFMGRTTQEIEAKVAAAEEGVQGENHSSFSSFSSTGSLSEKNFASSANNTSTSVTSVVSMADTWGKDENNIVLLSEETKTFRKDKPNVFEGEQGFTADPGIEQI